jgi:hypothetical protein
MDREGEVNCPNRDDPNEQFNYGSVIKTPPSDPPRADKSEVTDPNRPGSAPSGDFR